jgi:hypothetical protein
MQATLWEGMFCCLKSKWSHYLPLGLKLLLPITVSCRLLNRAQERIDAGILSYYQKLGNAQLQNGAQEGDAGCSKWTSPLILPPSLKLHLSHYSEYSISRKQNSVKVVTQSCSFAQLAPSCSYPLVSFFWKWDLIEGCRTPFTCI